MLEREKGEKQSPSLLTRISSVAGFGEIRKAKGDRWNVGRGKAEYRSVDCWKMWMMITVKKGLEMLTTRVTGADIT